MRITIWFIWSTVLVSSCDSTVKFDEPLVKIVEDGPLKASVCDSLKDKSAPECECLSDAEDTDDTCQICCTSEDGGAEFLCEHFCPEGSVPTVDDATLNKKCNEILVAYHEPSVTTNAAAVSIEDAPVTMVATGGLCVLQLKLLTSVHLFFPGEEAEQDSADFTSTTPLPETMPANCAETEIGRGVETGEKG